MWGFKTLAKLLHYLFTLIFILESKEVRSTSKFEPVSGYCQWFLHSGNLLIEEDIGIPLHSLRTYWTCWTLLFPIVYRLATKYRYRELWYCFIFLSLSTHLKVYIKNVGTAYFPSRTTNRITYKFIQICWRSVVSEGGYWITLCPSVRSPWITLTVSVGIFAPICPGSKRWVTPSFTCMHFIICVSVIAGDMQRIQTWPAIQKKVNMLWYFKR